MTHDQIVKTVRQRLRAMNITQYELHQRLGQKVSKQTVYNFIEHGKVVRSNVLAAVMTELDLEIRPREGK
jgi:hypothetical protein